MLLSQYFHLMAQQFFYLSEVCRHCCLKIIIKLNLHTESDIVFRILSNLQQEQRDITSMYM